MIMPAYIGDLIELTKEDPDFAERIMEVHIIDPYFEEK